MERDFTDAKLNELLSHINNGSGELNRNILGIASTYSHWNRSLEVDVCLGLVGLYLNALFDRHEKAATKLKNIFTDARSADSQYKSTFVLYNEGLKIYKDFIAAMAETVDPSKTLLDITALKSKVQTLNNNKSNNLRKVAIEIMAAFLSSSNVISTTDKAWLNEYADEIFQKQKDGKYLTQSEKDFLANYATAIIGNKKLETTNTQDNKYLEKYLDYLMESKVTGANIASLNADDRERMITVFEALHLGDAKNMDELFEDMAADTSGYDYNNEIQNIKYIVYTAEEPYRSVFLKNAGELEIANYTYTKDSQYYSGDKNKLYINFSSDPNTTCGINDYRGPYVVFFHECGHAIDDLSKKDGWFSTEWITADYKASNGNTILEAAVGDVRTNLENSAIAYAANPTNKITLTTDQLKSIVSDIMKPNSDKSKYATVCEEARVYTALVNKYSTDLADNSVYNGISDVYGGVTNNTVQGSSGHNDSYWYNSSGVSTEKQSRELWAHYFARNMTGSTASILAMENYFPEADKIMDEISLKISEK